MGNMAREVWFAEEAWLSFYQEIIGTGNFNPTPTHVLQYVQSVTVKKNFDLIVFGQPGALDQDVDSIPSYYGITIAEFFYLASEQWTPFLDSTQRWRVAILNINPRYDGVNQANDPIILRMAAIAAPSINFRSNDLQNFSWDFKAESRESGGVIVSP